MDPHHELAEILDPTPDPTTLEIFLPIIAMVYVVVFGILVAMIVTGRRGGDPGSWGCFVWGMFGGFFGPIALLIALLIPRSKAQKAEDARFQAAEDARIKRDKEFQIEEPDEFSNKPPLKVCPNCGVPLGKLSTVCIYCGSSEN